MQTKNDQVAGSQGAETEAADTLDSSKEATLEWLMELDRDDPEENVFVVDRRGGFDFSLSAQEAAVAARPMMRGRADADDLSTYVEEEIVMGEPGALDTSGKADEVAAAQEQEAFDSLMAVDFSRQSSEEEGLLQNVEDGIDILGLEEDDDIGDQYLVVKRVKKPVAEPAQPVSAEAEAPGQLPVAETGQVEPEPEGDTPLVAEAAAEVEDELEFEAPPMAAEQEPLAAEAESIELEAVGPEAVAPGTVELEPIEFESVAPAAAEEESIELTAVDFEDIELEAVEPEPVEAAQEHESIELEAIEFESVAPPAAETETTEVAEATEAEPDFMELAESVDSGPLELAAALGDELDASLEPLEGEDDWLVPAAQDGALDAAANAEEADDFEFGELDLTADATGARDVDDLPDYHEDFAELTREGDLLTEITPRIAALMEELHTALAARLDALGWEAGAVAAEVSIAPDAESAREARESGYELVGAICSETPDSLAGLEAGQMDAIYLRLYQADNGENRNRIFHEDPPAAGEAASDAKAAQTVATEAPATVTRKLHLVESRVFDEDLLAEDIDAPLEAADSEWTPESEEIEAMFSDIDSDPFEVEFDAPPLEEPGEEPAGEAAAAAQAEVSYDEPELAAPAAEAALEEAMAEEVLAEEAPIDQAPAEPEGNALAADLSWCIPEDIEFSRCSPTGGEIFAEFLDAFIEEGSSELEKLEDAIRAWEADSANAECQAVVGRVLHTIKGIAKGVGLHYYGTLIHNFETLLEKMDRPAAGADSNYFRVVNAWLDAAVRGVEFVQAERQDIPCELPYRDTPEAAARQEVGEAGAAEQPEAAAPVAQATAPAPGDPDAPDAASDEARRKQEDKRLADEGARVLAAQQSVRITSEKLDLLLNLANQAQQLGVRTTQSANRTKRATAELQGRLTSIRAHLSDIGGGLFNVSARGGSAGGDLDALEMDRYSELQEAANILREGIEDIADLIDVVSRHNGQAEALLKQQSTVIGSIGSSIRAARVVPVSRLTPGLRRLVRTVSADLGKEVAFRVTNEVGTLDRDDYARCQTILEHMVRNALDHGIESAEDRKAAGKPSVGQITLDVRMSGADSVIVLSDDGRGMDPAKIRQSAKDKGIEADIDGMSDEEALKLIFHKGFSTASQLSQISGRGVGMDIVASELQKMGGEIRIVSEVGKGTAFHLRIPSNVAVNGALLVTAGENSYAIPLGGLVAVDELPVDTFFGAVERRENLNLAGLQCEPAYLGTLCKSGNLPDRQTWRKTIPVIIAGSESRYMAIAVDDVEEALELVVRSLGAQFAAVPGVAGGATTADGEAVVALDLNVLVNCFSEEQGIAIELVQPGEDKLLALVVDDSRTQRMVATSQLESVGLETATAENGAVAIDWLNTTERLPDIVLMDVEMPVKDGIQALREIRKSARFSHIPVIMITSRTGVKHRSLAEEAGCNGYMGKPFNFRMLMGQINELTGHRLDLEQQG